MKVAAHIDWRCEACHLTGEFMALLEADDRGRVDGNRIEVALLAAHNHAVIASREEGSERKILECQGPDLKKLKWLGRFVYNIP